VKDEQKVHKSLAALEGISFEEYCERDRLRYENDNIRKD